MKAAVATIVTFMAVLSLGVAGVGTQLERSETGRVYHGQFEPGEVPFSGTVDLEFSVWDAESGGAQLGPTQPVCGVEVVEDSFAVELDSGPEACIDETSWLEIAIAAPAGSGVYCTPSWRFPLTPTLDQVVIAGALPPLGDETSGRGGTLTYKGMLNKGQKKEFSVKHAHTVEVFLTDCNSNQAATWIGHYYNNWFCGSRINSAGTSAKSYAKDSQTKTVVGIGRGRAETFSRTGKFRLNCTANSLEYAVMLTASP